jgi:hypothetical protein
MGDIQSTYKSYKLKLPDFNALNNEFEISVIESTDFLLRQVRRKISEKVEVYSDVLVKLIQPESSMCEMFECKVLAEKDKEDIYSLLMRLMFIQRYGLEVEVIANDAQNAEFINYVFDNWQDIKQKFLIIASKLKDSWKKEHLIKEKLEYFG